MNWRNQSEIHADDHQITRYRAGTELNDEFFKMAFPEGNVKNADEFAQYRLPDVQPEPRIRFLYARHRRMLLDKANLTARRLPQTLAFHDQRG